MTRLINMEQIQVLSRQYKSIWVSYADGDEGELEFHSEEQAQAEFERIRGLLMEGHKCRECK